MAETREPSPHGPGTRAVHAGLPEAVPGGPIGPSPVLSAPFHSPGDPVDPSVDGYARTSSPTTRAFEAAMGEMDGGASVVFASGMAAITAAVLPVLLPGEVLVAPSDGYPGIRALAKQHLGPRGVEVRLVPTDEAAIRAVLPGARMVLVESPANPGLDVIDLPALADEVHAAGALLAVDNTVATPLGQQPLALGADLAAMSGTKSLSGHGDLLIGVVSARDPELLARVREWRETTGAIPGPFETFLAHRSLATLDLRLERSSGNALAVAELLAARDDVQGVRYPGLPGDPGHAVAARQMRHFGAVVAFVLRDAETVRRFFAASELVADATSFGAIHTTAERRARWGSDDVPEGFVRFSAGCEDPEDLLADVAAALDAAVA